MFEVAAEIVICLIFAALIGGIIGYILGKGSCPKSSTCHKVPEATHELHIDNQESSQKTESEETSEKKEVNLGTKPTTLISEARDGEKDNLQLIKGVGPVLEKLLNDTGIYHFDQLATLTEDGATWLNIALGFPKRVEREKWREQSQELAENLK